MWGFHYTGGSWQASAPPNRGLSFGDGAFETMRLHEGRLLFAEAHQTRLTSALEVLGLRLPCSWEALLEPIQHIAVLAPNARIKVLAVRAGEGAYTPSTQEALLWVSASPLPVADSYPLGPSQQLIVYPHRLLTEMPWSCFKTLSALAYVQAARFARERGFSDAILLSVEGFVAETSRANLFWYDGQALHTPPLHTGAVGGILRARVMALAAALGFSVKETLAFPEHLVEAHEVFTTNVIQGLAPVKALTLHRTYFYSEPRVLPWLAEAFHKSLSSALG